MLLYGYDKHGAFTGSLEADIDPLETQLQQKLVYLRPAETTEIAPPPFGESQIPVFDTQAQAWSVVNDFRPEVYDITSGIMVPWFVPGDLPPGCASTPPPDNVSTWNETTQQWEQDASKLLDATRAQKLQQIRDEALTRSSVHVPEIASYEVMQTIYGALSDITAAIMTPRHSSAKPIFDYAESKISEMQIADQATLDAYDATTDPSFPT